MSFLRGLSLAGWALALVCCAGCASSRTSVSSDPAGSSGEASQSASVEPMDDLQLEERAKAHAHYANAVLLELSEESEPALEEFAQAALLDPNNETLALDVSQRYLARGKADKAVEVLTNVTARTSPSGDFYTQLGIAWSTAGNTEAAIGAYRIAIEKSPRFLAPYQNLFILLMQGKQPVEAQKLLDRALKLSDSSAPFLVGLAELYTALSRQVPARREATRSSAMTALNRADKLNPTNPHLRLKLADGFDQLGAPEKAAPIYLELVEFYEEFPLQRSGLREKLVDLYLRNADRTNAQAQLEALVQDQPTNPKPYFYLGTLALEQHQPEKAADYFDKAILVNSEFTPAYLDLARAQISLDRPKEALATLDKARRKTGDSFAVQFLSGLACAREKDYDTALSHYTAAELLAQTAQPRHTNEFLYFQIGSAYERKGDREEAAKYFQLALTVEPDFADALNYLGYMWAERGENLSEARKLIERAVKLEPKNAAYLDSMGWVLFKLGHPREALDYLLKAVEYSEEPDATLYDHLGDIYAALNQHDKADEAWRKSLAIEPNETIQAKLARDDAR